MSPDQWLAHCLYQCCVLCCVPASSTRHNTHHWYKQCANHCCSTPRNTDDRIQNYSSIIILGKVYYWALNLNISQKILTELTYSAGNECFLLCHCKLEALYGFKPLGKIQVAENNAILWLGVIKYGSVPFKKDIQCGLQMSPTLLSYKDAFPSQSEASWHSWYHLPGAAEDITCCGGREREHH